MLGVVIRTIFSDYGLFIERFVIVDINVPETDPNRQLLEDAFAKKGIMKILGEDWGRQIAANILGDLANNPGSGGVASAGAGLGMGIAAGGVFGGMAQQLFSPIQQQQPTQPVQPQPFGGRFMQKSAEESKENPVEKIKQLKEMLDFGAISQTEFDLKKQEILNRI